MVVIGLTGGIGSGKSTVAHFFAELGIEIIDTDQLARDVIDPGTAALTELIAHFGAAVLDEKKQLDRRKLRDIVFQNPVEREWLEKLLHPLIRQKMKELVAQAKSSYCIVVIPLLVESKPNKLINRVLVVDAPEEHQLDRAQQRDHISREQALAILKAQVTREKRLAAAHDIIYNNSDLDYVREQVQQLHKKYLALSTRK